MRRSTIRRSTNCGLAGALLAFGCCLSGPAFAASGMIEYAVGNCFIMETSEGRTLFERSGGEVPADGQAVTGELHDFGYQQLYNGEGQELFVGWIQNWGVSDAAEIQAFKDNCR